MSKFSLRGKTKRGDIKRLTEKVEEMRQLFVETHDEGARNEWARAIRELDEANRNK